MKRHYFVQRRSQTFLGVYMLSGFSCNMRILLVRSTTAVFWMLFPESKIFVSR